MASAASHLASILLLALVLAVNSHSHDNLCKNRSRKCPADRDEPWTYRGRNGPAFWGRTYENCNGDKQSPINIDTSEVEKDENLAQLELSNYDEPISQATIENNGHTVEVVPRDDTSRTISVNGKTYSLQQFHFHWGCVPYRGSEHAVDGKYYAMELHLVHMSEDNEIAVVGVFLEEQDAENEELQKIVDQLSDVRYKDTEAQLKSSVNLNNLVPANPTSYYRYEGSLTTPGCAEGVTWSVVPEPIAVSKSQMNEFRKLYSATEDMAAKGCRLAGNFRPVQPLNDRTVFLSQ